MPAPAGVKFACVDRGPSGRFCGSGCADAASCPSGYACAAAGLSLQCQPEAGDCPCLPAFVTGGFVTTCYVENDAGRCEGSRTCDKPCDARTPAPEACNTGDDDCDGLTDEEVPSKPCDLVNAQGTCTGTTACQAGAEVCTGTLAVPEACNGTDDDCDGSTDEPGATGCVEYYKDADGDLSGATGDSQCLCVPASPYTALDGGDCDDSDGLVHPGLAETCDGRDNDCNGITDDPGASGCQAKYFDSDGDGFGIESDVRCLCVGAGLYTAPYPGDCDDGDFAIYPKAPEVCNGHDDDCDGEADEDGADGCVVRYPDADGDGFGAFEGSRCLCDPTSPGLAEASGDCDDSDPDIHPGAAERCDGKDDDCDGQGDAEGAEGCVPYWFDADGDGFGATEETRCLCGPEPPWSALDGGDCDDTDVQMNPGVPESCDGLDNDCDGITDSANAIGCTSFGYDVDGDLHWDPTKAKKCLCESSGYYRGTLGPDCDDTDPESNPDHAETCGDGRDNDCDGQTDEAGADGCTDFFLDADRDGWGSVVAPARCLCGPEPTADYVAKQGGDCLDADSTVFPGASETCNGKDDDCDGGTDETVPGMCDDGDACTDGDACVSGACVHSPAKCDDANPCTDDSCDPAAGCIHKTNTKPCDDGNPCTISDTCGAGKCIPGPGPNCDDNNPCTDDSCSAGVCSHAAHVGSCVDPAHPGCNGTCIGTVCTGATESLNGLDDDCDGAVDEDFDLDHDGVCDSTTCAVKAVDKCPTVWSPDNSAALCPVPGPAWAWSRSVRLGQSGTVDGASTWRRTNEPVEVPLVNGILDDSVLGYWKLDHGLAKDFSAGLHDGTATGTVPGPGAFGDAGGAPAFNGSSSKVSLAGADGVAKGRAAAGYSLSLWFRIDGMTQANRQFLWHDGTATTRTFLDVNPSGILTWTHDAGALALGKPSLATWHHFAAVWDGARVTCFLDGVFTASQAAASMAAEAEGTILGNQFGGAASFKGALDDVILFGRPLAPEEIGALAASWKPFGTALAAGAQPDFDDVRIVETSDVQATHAIPAEILGPRPHSDTDLAGVAAYWKLDGDAADSGPGAITGTLTNGVAPVAGRFGDGAGALRFDGIDDQVGLPALVAPAGVQLGDFTAEAWFSLDDLSTARRNVLLDLGREAGTYRPILWLAVETHDGTCDVVHGMEWGSGACTSFRVPVPCRAGAWHHTALVRAGTTLSVFFDGLPLSGTLDSACSAAVQAETVTLRGGGRLGSRGGSSSGSNHFLRGRLDDVLLHSKARPADYFYHRARPALPTVRFLAHTRPYSGTGGRYDFLDYAIRWGNASAPAAPVVVTALDKTTKCDGLLSPCLGYSGWWRLDEGSGTVAVDASTRKLNGSILNSPDWTAGAEGTALTLVPSQHVSVPNNAAFAFGTGSFTVEAVARQTGSGAMVASKYVSSSITPRWELRMSAFFASATFNSSIASGLPVSPPSARMTLAGIMDRGQQKMTMVQDHVATGTAAIKSAGAFDNSQAFTIGRQSGTSSYFTGMVDSVRLTGRALALDEMLHYPLASWKWGPWNPSDHAASPPSPAGRLPGFKYRVPVVLSLPSGTGSAPVDLVLDTATPQAAGRMLTDCRDLRIVAEDGATLLPYWIESGCGTVATRVWARVPSVKPQVVFAYYGNADAVPAPQPDAVFAFFDGFDAWDSGRWEGGRWCYGFTAGSWVPTIVSSKVQLRASDVCWGQIRTKQTLALPVRVLVGFTPFLFSGGGNEDAAVFSLGKGFAAYTELPAARLDLTRTGGTLARPVGGVVTFGAGLGTAQAPTRMVMDLLDDGRVRVVSPAGIADYLPTGVLDPVSIGLSVKDSTDGFDADFVAAGRPVDGLGVTQVLPEQGL
jgi:hypothetical protein